MVRVGSGCAVGGAQTEQHLVQLRSQQLLTSCSSVLNLQVMDQACPVHPHQCFLSWMFFLPLGQVFPEVKTSVMPLHHVLCCEIHLGCCSMAFEKSHGLCRSRPLQGQVRCRFPLLYQQAALTCLGGVATCGINLGAGYPSCQKSSCPVCSPQPTQSPLACGISTAPGVRLLRHGVRAACAG